MTAQLLLRDGRDPLRTIVLHGQVYRIGRDPDAEVPVMHPAVSKRHALLELRQERWQPAGEDARLREHLLLPRVAQVRPVRRPNLHAAPRQPRRLA